MPLVLILEFESCHTRLGPSVALRRVSLPGWQREENEDEDEFEDEHDLFGCDDTALGAMQATAGT